MRSGLQNVDYDCLEIFFTNLELLLTEEQGKHQTKIKLRKAAK